MIFFMWVGENDYLGELKYRDTQLSWQRFAFYERSQMGKSGFFLYSDGDLDQSQN